MFSLLTTAHSLVEVLSKTSLKTDFQHITSSPYYAQSNGEAETILKQSHPFTALMSYTHSSYRRKSSSADDGKTNKNYSSHSGVSPATWMAWSAAREKSWSKDEKDLQEYYNKRNGVRTLPELPLGTSVAVELDAGRGRLGSGTILRKCESPRSYLIQSETGVFTRNRQWHWTSIYFSSTNSEEKLSSWSKSTCYWAR